MPGPFPAPTLSRDPFLLPSSRFCDGDAIDIGKVGKRRAKGREKNSKLACLEELVTEIDEALQKPDDKKSIKSVKQKVIKAVQRCNAKRK